MKIVWLFVSLICSLAVIVFAKTLSQSQLIGEFDANLEALTEVGEKPDGALWYNDDYSLICCGPGNVRFCDGVTYVDCDFE